MRKVTSKLTCRAATTRLYKDAITGKVSYCVIFKKKDADRWKVAYSANSRKEAQEWLDEHIEILSKEGERNE